MENNFLASSMQTVVWQLAVKVKMFALSCGYQVLHTAALPLSTRRVFRELSIGHFCMTIVCSGITRTLIG